MLAFLLVDAAWKRRTDRVRAGALVGAAVLAVAISLWALPNLLYLGKVAGRLAMPAGLMFLVLAAATAHGWWRRDRRQTAIAGVVFVAFTLLGNGALGGWLLAGLESDYVVNDASGGGPLEAIFVLGGSTATSPRSGRARLGDAGDRLLTAARTFRDRDVGLVVTSGSSIPGIGGAERSVARESAEILVELGVPADRIEQHAEPKNSSQEVAEYKRVADAHGWKRLGIVTSAWHMRRVQRLCRRVGLEAEPIPADFRGHVGWDGLLSLIPDGQGFRDVQRAAWEILGAAVGR